MPVLDQAHDRTGQKRSAAVFRFKYEDLLEKGFAAFARRRAELIVTFRGNSLIDAFDAGTWQHVAFLDFDLQREIHLNSVLGSPLIGLPFSATLRHTQGVSLNRFDDLRQKHHYGFFVETDYRNKRRKGIWNLDELMLAIALVYAEDCHLPWFRIKPTGDTAAYYRHKYGATRRPTTSAEKILSIRLGPDRQPLPHTHSVKIEGKTRYLEVETGPDTTWPQN